MNEQPIKKADIATSEEPDRRSAIEGCLADCSAKTTASARCSGTRGDADCHDHAIATESSTPRDHMRWHGVTR